MDRIFTAPLWIWMAFTAYFALVGFGVGYAVNQLRRSPPIKR